VKLTYPRNVLPREMFEYLDNNFRAFSITSRGHPLNIFGPTWHISVTVNFPDDPDFVSIRCAWEGKKILGLKLLGLIKQRAGGPLGSAS